MTKVFRRTIWANQLNRWYQSNCNQIFLSIKLHLKLVWICIILTFEPLGCQYKWVLHAISLFPLGLCLKCTTWSTWGNSKINLPDTFGPAFGSAFFASVPFAPLFSFIFFSFGSFFIGWLRVNFSLIICTWMVTFPKENLLSRVHPTLQPSIIFCISWNNESSLSNNAPLIG